MVDGHAWISAMPEELHRQRRVVAGLLGVCEETATVSSLSVGCSLGRGAGDALSDVDAAIGVAAARGAAGAPRVREVEESLLRHLPDLGTVVDVLRQESLTGEFFIRRLFVQLDDRVQLDLAVIAEAEVRRGASAPDFVPLYRTAEQVEAVAFPPAHEVSEDQVHDWAFLGWRALLDADKYLQRGSLWEAHHRLHEARGHVWALWAAARGAAYPWHGLSQVLDHDPSSLPAGVEATVAGLDADELRRAVQVSVSVLDDVSQSAARQRQASLPTAMAGYVRDVLTAGRSLRP